MSTTRKFFKNTVENTFDGVKTLITDFNRFEFVNNERADALAEIDDILNEFNADNKNTAIMTAVNSGDIINAMIPSITLDGEKAKKSNERKKAIQYAVSYDFYKHTADGDKHEIRLIKKALSIRDIYGFLCELSAFKNADGKITKTDRKKAQNTILNADRLHALRMFMYGAYKFENVSDIKKTFILFQVPTDDEKALFFDGEPSKAKAEKQIKAVAKMLNLGDINFKRIHALTLYKRAYTIDKFHQAKTAHVLDFLQDFIIASRYAKNNIDLPDIKDIGGIFTTDETTKTADNVIKF